MEIALPAPPQTPTDPTWPDEASLAAFRAWLQGVPSRDAVDRYLPHRRTAGASARSVIGRVKRQLVAFATSRAQADLAATFAASSPSDRKLAKAAAAAIETLRGMPPPQPLIGDAVERWLPARLVRVLHAEGFRTLADLTLRVPRRRRWWSGIAGLGPDGARHIGALFAQHPALTERARALITVNQAQELVPWERLVVPEDVDGSRGTFRAPRASCALDASHDYEAVTAWLSLHESAATQRAYRKEAERLIGEPDGAPLELLGKLIGKMRRALALTHLEATDHGPQVNDRLILRGTVDSDPDDDHRVPMVVIDGREISWDELGRLVAAFEGWQFKLEFRDLSKEV